VSVLLHCCRAAVILHFCVQSDRPVWQQLCDRLDKSPILAGHRLQQHKQEKQQLQEQVAQLQQRVTDLKQENAGLQQLPQQVMQLQQQVADLERQNAELLQQLCDRRA
jgi:TolA-binding protein